MALLEHHRCLIQNRQGAVFDYAVLRHGAEHGNLALDVVIHRLVNAGYDRTRPRRYLNDHNEAVPFRKTGLEPEDMEVFARFGIKP